MADIAMCTNKTCPVKKECYRFMAPVNLYRQSYMGFKVKDENGCEDKIELEPDQEDEV